ncbi:MAG TPA: aminotransferase class V-fold PLP-dependent enzyme [Thermoanaerobaculia bacterium]|nr:aminotransferase class V-fold PLP-dependent enzyme [Thermoanaerobaculia bacterium]
MLTFKIADAPHEHEQIHALSYRAFVEEIPQHQPNEARLHVDRFHDENVYAISKAGEKLVGMIAVRGRRPFSLDGKLADLDRYLPPGRNPCEVRLLAIDKEHRAGAVLPGLLSVLWQHAAEEHFDCAVISATTRQLKLYGHLGFVAFGPLVGTADAPFQPMFITREMFQERARALTSFPPAMRGEVANFLPGPVTVHEDVSSAFRSAPESHRAPAFLADLDALRADLRALLRANFAEVLVGSGTLANDCVAAQLARLGRGVVVSNGEFGERLADHAARMRLEHAHVRVGWGEPLDLDAVRNTLEDAPAWLWVVACETSCGVMNDLTALAALCRESGTKFCVDAVSAVGAVPLDLRDVYLASGTSGKALAAYPGLAIVFHRDPIVPSHDLPRYLDLGMYATDGVPFTHSSNLVRALRTAVARVDWPKRHEEIAEQGATLRRRLASLGLDIVGTTATPAPHVVTIAVPDAPQLARRLERSGFLVAHASDYLRKRNWIQFALMGETSRDGIAALLRELRRQKDA